MPCVKCGNKDVEVHHPDYSKPLNVKWVCKQHHREIHKKTKVNGKFHEKDQQIWISKNVVDKCREKASKERRTLKTTIEMAIEAAIEDGR